MYEESQEKRKQKEEELIKQKKQEKFDELKAQYDEEQANLEAKKDEEPAEKPEGGEQPVERMKKPVHSRLGCAYS